jgi:hypothetical protein
MTLRSAHRFCGSIPTSPASRSRPTTVQKKGDIAALIIQGNADDALSGKLGWQHVFDTTALQAGKTLTGADAFTLNGTDFLKNVVNVNLSVDIALTDSPALSLRYSGGFGGAGQSNSVAVSLKVNVSSQWRGRDRPRQYSAAAISLERSREVEIRTVSRAK